MRSGSRYLSAVAAIVLTGAVSANPRAAAQSSQAPASGRPLMVEDVFTNVQALKGIGVDDFMLTMGIMSAAVGSDCVGCHPSAGTDHVDWALDTPRKRTARRMVQMVTGINRDTFNGRQVVTCWTCHRGRDRPVTTPTLDVVYGPPADEADDVLVQAQGVATVEQVLNKYLQALGGAANVARITSFVATGKSVGYKGFGGGGAVEVAAQAPDKRATHISFPEYPDRGVSVRTYDGRTGWIATPLAVVPKYELAGSERDGARLDAMLAFPAQITQALTSLRVGPPTTIADTAAPPHSSAAAGARHPKPTGPHSSPAYRGHAAAPVARMVARRAAVEGSPTHANWTPVRSAPRSRLAWQRRTIALV